MKKEACIFLALALWVTIQGCASQEGAGREASFQKQSVPTPTPYETENLISEISREIAGKVYYELYDRSERNLSAKLAVVNAVPLSDLKRETEFGRLLGELVLTDLADRGLRVRELRLGQDIRIIPLTGEFIMSRNVGELASQHPELDFVVVHTFSNTKTALILQGRLIDLNNGLITASWRYNLPLNTALLGLFREPDSSVRVTIKGP